MAARASSSTKRFFQKGPEAAEVGEAEAPGAEGHYKSARIRRYPLYSADFPLNQSIERSVTSWKNILFTNPCHSLIPSNSPTNGCKGCP